MALQGVDLHRHLEGAIRLETMLDEGIPIAICTDDPALFAIDLPSELRLVETQMGVSSAALEAMQAHAQRYFFR